MSGQDTLVQALRAKSALESMGPGLWLDNDAVDLSLERVCHVPRVELCAISSTVLELVIRGICGPDLIGDIRAKIVGKSYVFLPVCHDAHWVLFVYAPTDNRVYYLDSMGGDVNEAIGGPILDFLAKIRGEEYQLLLEDIEIQDVPRQSNGYDCGVMVIRFAQLMVYGVPDQYFTGPELSHARKALRVQLVLEKGCALYEKYFQRDKEYLHGELFRISAEAEQMVHHIHGLHKQRQEALSRQAYQQADFRLRSAVEDLRDLQRTLAGMVAGDWDDY